MINITAANLNLLSLDFKGHVKDYCNMMYLISFCFLIVVLKNYAVVYNFGPMTLN